MKTLLAILAMVVATLFTSNVIPENNGYPAHPTDGVNYPAPEYIPTLEIPVITEIPTSTAVILPTVIPTVTSTPTPWCIERENWFCGWSPNDYATMTAKAVLP